MIFHSHPLGRAGVFMYHFSTLGINKTSRKQVKIVFLKSGDVNLRFHGHYRKTHLHYKCPEVVETLNQDKAFRRYETSVISTDQRLTTVILFLGGRF